MRSLRVSKLVCTFGCVLLPSLAGNADDIVVSDVLVTLARQAEVPARENGMVTELSVREGDAVSVGDLIARIDDGEARLQVEQAKLAHAEAVRQANSEVDLQLARASLEAAAEELRRARESRARYAKSVSDSDLARLELEARHAELEVERAEHQISAARHLAALRENELALAKLALSKRHVIAPLDGVVVQVVPRVGEWVQLGQVTVRIVDVRRLRAEGFMDVAKMEPNMQGRAVSLSVSDTGSSANPPAHKGKLVFVSPEVNPVTRQVRVFAEIDNVDGTLSPGLPATMIIEPNHRKEQP